MRGSSRRRLSMDVLDEVTLAADAQTVTLTVPAGYRHLRVEYAARDDQVAINSQQRIIFNGDTGNNYYSQVHIASATTAQAAESLAAAAGRGGGTTSASGTAGLFSTGVIEIPDHGGGNIKSWSVLSNSAGSTGTGTVYTNVAAGWWNSTAAITSITLRAGLSGTPSYAAGSRFTLYGLTGLR